MSGRIISNSLKEEIIKDTTEAIEEVRSSKRGRTS